MDQCNTQPSGHTSGNSTIDAPPVHARVFVNRNLRMDTIAAVGFDMDYTIAQYRREHLEKLAHRLTIDKLIERGYPEALRQLQYDKNFVIRGLTVDKQTGNILKLDRHNHVGRVFHGRRQLSKTERVKIYRSKKLDFTPPRFALVDTLFSLPEMCLYADLIDLLEKTKQHVDTWKLFDDTRESIDEAHRDDTLKSVVKDNLDTYVERDPLLCKTLHKLRSSGKKLFLLTNSYWEYTNALMTYLLDNELPEYPTWRSYFEVIVVGSKKPTFFTGDDPMAEIDDEGRTIVRPAYKFERGHIYQGGNLTDFEAALGHSGEEIIYIGDHIYGDILSSKKVSLWRTALVVEEIEDEIRMAQQHHEEMEQLSAMELERRHLDDLVNLYRRQMTVINQSGKKHTQTSPSYNDLRMQRDQCKRKLRTLLNKMARLTAVISSAFNPNWGMVFKDERDNSRFGQQVADYACLYTGRVSNFYHYSAYQYFRSPRDIMPHEQV